MDWVNLLFLNGYSKNTIFFDNFPQMLNTNLLSLSNMKHVKVCKCHYKMEVTLYPTMTTGSFECISLSSP